MKKLFLISLVALLAFSCDPDEPNPPVPTPEPEGVLVNASETVTGGIQGLFLLNEGAMGANNATLDYYDYSTGRYITSIFDARNPGETLGLGDTGNDLQIYNGRLYAVINGSNYLEVIDAATVKLVGKIAIPNPRSITFDGDHAYVTSFAGAEYGADDNRIGYVAKIDLGTLKVVDECNVGYQPEELAVVGGKLYVANSGGYMAEYETSVSVIDLATFTETEKIEVAPNLWRMRPDGKGNLYVSSRGDYGANPAATYLLDTATGEVTSTPIYTDNITIAGNTLYAIGTGYGPAPDYAQTNSYSTYNISTGQAGGSFITDGTDSQIAAPYGPAIHPATGEILMGDAKNYSSDGVLSCYTAAGVRKWQVSTGVIPGHFAFTTTKLVHIDDL